MWHIFLFLILAKANKEVFVKPFPRVVCAHDVFNDIVAWIKYLFCLKHSKSMLDFFSTIAE